MATGKVNTGTKLVPLWTNPSPTSSFAAQDVSVDLSPYDWFVVETRWSTTSDLVLPLEMFEVDENRHMVWMGNNSSNRTGGRVFTYSVANQEISFEGGYYNGSASNAYVIPLAVYGVKL